MRQFTRCSIVLRPLTEPARRRIFGAAAMLCAVPVLLAPLAGRSSFELREEREAFQRRFAVPHVSANVLPAPVIARDPFVPQASETETVHVAAGTLMKAAHAVVVRAIVSGPSPRALIEEEGRVRIVAAGDMVRGARVMRIGESAILLSDHAILTLEERMP